MGLGHEGAHPQAQAQARHRPLESQQQFGGALDVRLLLRGQSGHAVELQGAEAALLGIAGGGEDLLTAELFVHHAAQALTAAFDRDGERLAAPFGQDFGQLRRDRGGPHRADAHPGALEALLIEPAQQVGELGMLGDGSAQQAQPLGGLQPGLHRRDQAVVEGGGAKRQGEVAGQAEAAELRAAAGHLHHVDRGPGGLRGDHRGVAEGVAPPGLLGHRGRNRGLERFDRQQLAFGAVAGCIQGGHVDAGHLGQGVQPFSSGSVAPLQQRLDKGGQQLFAVAEQHHIEEGGQRFGIGGEHRSAAEHDRIAIAALVAPQRDALAFEQIQQHRAIQLPAQRKAEQLRIAVPRVALVGEQAADVEIGAAGERGPHHLVAEAGDAHRVGAGEGQHRAQGAGLGHGGLEQQGFLIQGVPVSASSFSGPGSHRHS